MAYNNERNKSNRPISHLQGLKNTLGTKIHSQERKILSFTGMPKFSSLRLFHSYAKIFWPKGPLLLKTTLLTLKLYFTV